MLSAFVSLLRAASLMLCLVVIASFAIFAVNQTKSASAHQAQEVLSVPAASAGQGASASGTSTGTGAGAATHENEAHRLIDDVAGKATSPFAGVVSGSHSEWLVRGVKLALALLVYGLGLGFLARTLRVRI